ncbi:DNA starvation/stationary phase protection protein [Taibaiella sp. KBW10]|uniref:Dps family protein n=1 Tax=Taibaiella sp. KBW10 TaxID=2153357 RepID=UPI000F5A1B8B|nr:DNA starvation/stationary phase protection protein [Taibaiella sp. KBW10]RQO32390.1 DNA starvation/stationary phase protection protein [Taibaiella sp. KBW10]
MRIDIGISAENLKKVNGVLNNVLANGNIIYIKLRKFHWNVSGPDFMEYHKLFEEQYEAIAQAIDDVAERISTLGGMAAGTTSEFAKLSELKETPGKCPAPLDMLKELLADHETIIKGLRKGVDDCDEKYKDAGTADFLTELMQDHEKMAWKLRHYFR